MTATSTEYRVSGPDGVATVSNDDLMARLDVLFRQKAAVDGAIVVLLGEVDRRAAYRDEGATGVGPWVVERFGVSTPTARAYAHVAERAWDLPHLVASLSEGGISFDKLRAVSDVATPETDREVLEQARECSVRQLGELARKAPSTGEADHERRFVRFNDHHRTLTAQLPPDSYAEVRSCLETRARKIPSDGETPWDQRLCDALLETIRTSGGGTGSASPYLVVAHVPLDALIDESGEATGLAGELETDDLISCETVQRIACDATIAIAVDDDVGHTMFEGRARREPTDAQRREIRRRDRHCRFPGCTNAIFTNAHHVKPWKTGGTTDIDNLALLCLHHHRRVHSGGWRMSGDANELLTFVGPTGRVMTSRPSPLWRRATRRTAARPGRAPAS